MECGRYESSVYLLGVAFYVRGVRITPVRCIATVLLVSESHVKMYKHTRVCTQEIREVRLTMTVKFFHPRAYVSVCVCVCVCVRE